MENFHPPLKKRWYGWFLFLLFYFVIKKKVWSLKRKLCSLLSLQNLLNKFLSVKVKYSLMSWFHRKAWVSSSGFPASSGLHLLLVFCIGRQLMLLAPNSSDLGFSFFFIFFVRKKKSKSECWLLYKLART